jgi:hypothetical protein
LTGPALAPAAALAAAGASRDRCRLTIKHSPEDLKWHTTDSTATSTSSGERDGFGRLGDRYGHKRIFLISLALFAVGSAACAFSTTVAEFMAARVLLGLAGAGVIVMAIASLTVLFDRAERPKAVGILAAGNFLAMPIGPILGGWPLTNFW